MGKKTKIIFMITNNFVNFNVTFFKFQVSVPSMLCPRIWTMTKRLIFYVRLSDFRSVLKVWWLCDWVWLSAKSVAPYFFTTPYLVDANFRGVEGGSPGWVVKHTTHDWKVTGSIPGTVETLLHCSRRMLDGCSRKTSKAIRSKGLLLYVMIYIPSDMLSGLK